MKSLPLLAIALFVGCAVTDEPTTSSTSSAVSGWTDSESWDPNKNVGADLWPVGITTTNILYRKGPDICPLGNNGNCTHAYLAFVVWNHTTVGHVYWIPENQAVGGDFHDKVDSIYATRSNGVPDHWFGGNGGTAGGTPPVPHPNVYGVLVCSFSPNYFSSVTNAAAAIEVADQSFLQYSE